MSKKKCRTCGHTVSNHRSSRFLDGLTGVVRIRVCIIPTCDCRSEKRVKI